MYCRYGVVIILVEFSKEMDTGVFMGRLLENHLDIMVYSNSNN